MRLLLVSDTHGDVAALRRALQCQPSAEVVIHLGDGEGDMAQVALDFPEKMVLQVRGNCDFGSQHPLADCFVVEGVRLFYTHGHGYQVNQGLHSLKEAAREKHANAVLYGHTHCPDVTYEEGLYVINPGSLHGYGATYATLDLTERGMVPNLIVLK